MKVVYLLGAGASYGSLSASPSVPPLGIQLFDKLVEFSSAWARLPADVQSEFKRADRPFEPGFELLRRTNDSLLPSLLRAMGLYFLQFKPQMGSAYIRFVDRLKSDSHQKIVATLNYDLLLDRVLASKQNGYVGYGSSVPRGQIPLLKLHGAPNLVHTAPISSTGGTFSQYVKLVDGPARFIRPDEAERRLASDDLPPAMALYAKGKEVLVCDEAVAQMQREFSDALKAADVAVVIGTAYVADDLHVWDPLISTDGRLLIVDPSADGFEPVVAARCGKDTRLKRMGFAEFVSQGSLVT
ncbi:hypothetical protein [Phenylobacterium sp.]|uniref:hypothetical protein n=1 Tax=Phenylobacterium sp. TaxID=1871053 RepID=UPI002DE6A6D8|nr:hypothetical protein [Phenylobacterium sp.]